jgi:hypothetical protein
LFTEDMAPFDVDKTTGKLMSKATTAQRRRKVAKASDVALRKVT